jgi:hypothetical protein
MYAQARNGFSTTAVLERLDGFILHYSAWKVGATQNPLAGRTEAGSPEGWRFWLMNSPAEARSLARILMRQGMARCELTNEAGTYLYIYPSESERFASGELTYRPEPPKAVSQ